jgi:hypothetical protein
MIEIQTGLIPGFSITCSDQWFYRNYEVSIIHDSIAVDVTVALSGAAPTDRLAGIFPVKIIWIGAGKAIFLYLSTGPCLSAEPLLCKNDKVQPVSGAISVQVARQNFVTDLGFVCHFDIVDVNINISSFPTVSSKKYYAILIGFKAR